MLYELKKDHTEAWIIISVLPDRKFQLKLFSDNHFLKAIFGTKRFPCKSLQQHDIHNATFTNQQSNVMVDEKGWIKCDLGVKR